MHESLETSELIRLVRKVPAALLADLEAGRLDIALCPVIDAQTSSRDLMVVPSGAIGSRSRTLTVRVFSQRPLDRIDHLHVDGDSHTSVALAQVIFQRRFGRTLEISRLHDPTALHKREDLEAALLIGDKVVTADPHGWLGMFLTEPMGIYNTNNDLVAEVIGPASGAEFDATILRLSRVRSGGAASSASV